MNELEILTILKRGPADAKSLASMLKISQPTFSRRIAPLINKGDVLRAGKARSSLYAGVRSIRGLPAGEEIPLYLVDGSGKPRLLAGTMPVLPEGLFVNGPVVSFGESYLPGNGLYDTVPFYLDSMRPEGFLGRNICRSIARESSLPSDLRNWNSDHLLWYLYHHGNDVPGSLIYGQKSLEKFLREEPLAIPFAKKSREYAELAERSLEGSPVGSSAGGERPKFTAFSEMLLGRDTRHVIVKFSPRDNTPEAERWRDLLMAEFHALKLLSENGFHSSSANLLDSNGRIMLEIQRYDRVGNKGRRPWVSLASIDDHLLGQRDAIRSTLRRMLRAGLIEMDEAREGITASLFGDFIGNTDQHPGNVSFTWDDAGLHPGPHYDILPMYYMPGDRPYVEKNQIHAFPVKIPEEAESYDMALGLSVLYWKRLCDDKSISRTFRNIAMSVAGSLIGMGSV
jgi:hypothetical protein